MCLLCFFVAERKDSQSTDYTDNDLCNLWTDLLTMELD